VISLHDILQNDLFFYVVMELCVGNLHDVISRQGHVPVGYDEVRELALLLDVVCMFACTTHCVIYVERDRERDRCIHAYMYALICICIRL